MAQFIKTAGVVDYTPGTAVAAGDIVVVGTIVGIAPVAIAANELGSLVIEGEVEGPKTAAQAQSGGALAYWDSDPGEFTTASSGNTLAGVFAPVGAGSSDTVTRVLLNV